ncbi:MAG TPA: biotin/lipoyl-containing protein [Thermoanaerobaculia bacterium]
MKFVARHSDGEQEVEVVRSGTGYRVRLDDRWVDADFVLLGHVRSLRLDGGTQYALVHHQEGQTHEISIRGTVVAVDVIDPLAARRKGREDEAGAGGVIKAMMPGRVVRLLVAPGDEVRKGAGLLILEAMKMENEIHAPSDGTIEAILVQPGQTVESGAELLQLAPAAVRL